MKTKKIFILPTILEGKSKIVELQGVMGTNEFISLYESVKSAQIPFRI